MRKLIYPFIFFALTVFGFFWYLQPTYNEIQSIQEEIAAYDRTLSQVQQLQTELNSELEKQDAITNQQLQRLNRMLPETVDTVRYLIELDQIAAQHGMSINGVSFSGAPERFGGSGGNDEGGGNDEVSNESNGSSNNNSVNGYNSLDTSFSVSGSYKDVQNFMRDIERSSRLMDIMSFQLSTADGGDEEGLQAGNNQYEFTIRTYWQVNNNSN